MQRFAELSSITATAWRRSRATLRRAGMICLAALCKLALVLAMAEAAVEIQVSNSEIIETIELGLSSHQQGPQRPSRGLGKFFSPPTLIGNSASASLRAGLLLAALSDGHRLANGLLAPMQC